MVRIGEREPIRMYMYEQIGGVPPAEILLGGGTSFTRVINGYRVGGNAVKDLSAFLGIWYTDLRGFVCDFGIEVYDGLSEDLTEEELEKMSGRIAGAINDHPQTRSFLLSSGSDNLEAVGRFLSNKLEEQLFERGINIYIFWSNHPLETDKFGKLTLRTAIEATRKKVPGGVYIASGNKIFPAFFASKESYHGVDMNIYDITDTEAAKWEKERRDFVGNQSAELVIRFFGLPVSEFIEKIRDPKKEVKLNLPAKHISKTLYSTELNLLDLVTNRTRHIQDREGLVVVSHLNNLETVFTGEFDRAKALLIVLNHSATTSMKNAQRLKDYFDQRRRSGKPILIFAVTENAEPHLWLSSDGIYPSGKVLERIAILLPEDVKTAHIKLLATYYDESLRPKTEVYPSDVIKLMITNHVGELKRAPSNSNIYDVRNQFLIRE